MSLLACTPAGAAADWYFTPFFGWDFGANTTLADLQYIGASRTKVTFGGSAALTIGIVGVEADYAFIPQFFLNPDPEPSPIPPPPVLGSHVQTITGNVILLAPLTWTRESLRPYLVGGLGWMDASVTYAAAEEAIPVNCSLTALNVGGGAIGMLGDRAGLRFDFRRFRGISPTSSSCLSVSSPRVNFWRASVGVTLRY
ncbi:MAG TPA: hypothetical protein VIX63_02565 [Vicinamibacterales bacterium]